MNDLRTVPVELLQQALEALGKWSTGRDMNGVELNDLIFTLEAALEEPVPHGCHCDLEEGMEPDGCVLDEGRPQHCALAGSLLRAGKDKTACEYWKPIEVKR